MTKAVIYARYSPRKGADTSESNETQRELCEKYAASKGYVVGGFFEDKAISGKDIHKVGLGKAIAALTRGSVLLVYKRDRIARDVMLAELARRQVSAAGATIEAVTGDVEGEGPYVKMVRQVLDAVAELERAMISERTSDAMRRHQAAGRKMSRFPPYGKQVDPADASKHVVNEYEMEAVAHIYELKDSGLGVCAIVRELNDGGYWQTRARTRKWNTTTAGKIIKRRDD